MFMNPTYLQYLAVILCCTTVHGVFRFANYYEDHMVLQRAPQKSIVWGYTDTTDFPITLAMNNKVYQATFSKSNKANDLTIWAVQLDAQPEEGPFQVKVSRKLQNGTVETIFLDDVLFGDVWVCSGQSNMEFAVNRMFNGTVEIENAYKYPKIRLFTAALRQAYTPEEELLAVGLHWSVASNVSVGSNYASAVCWLYGRMVQAALGGRPMGLVHSSWGGTGIEFWSPPEALKACGIEQIPTMDSQNEIRIDLNNSVLYNAMMHPFTRMVIKGALWYQGEHNTGGHVRDKYNCAFAKLIESWRSIWHVRTNSSTDPTFPFGFVQLATATNDTRVVGGFPIIRWHQTFDVGYVPNTKVPNVFMAVALDMRDDANGVHPRDKLDVGYRLSRSGLAVAYGFRNITYQGPIIAEVVATEDSTKVNVTYSRVVSQTIELRNPNGFEVCCAGKQVCSTNDAAWVPTPASRIEGIALTISLAVPNSCHSKPIDSLRYLWRETPCNFKEAAVYSGEDSDLPAPPYIHYF